MRGRIALAVLLVAVVTAAVAIARQDGATPARAQSTEPRPILVNEVFDWCANRSDCDRASFDHRPDGSLHVVFNVDPASGEFDAGCAVDILIPTDVRGWGYVMAPLDSPEFGRVVSTTEIKSTDTVCELVVSR